MRLSRSRIWLNVQKDQRFPLRLELDSGGFTAADASAHRAQQEAFEANESAACRTPKGRSHIARWRI